MWKNQFSCMEERNVEGVQKIERKLMYGRTEKIGLGKKSTSVQKKETHRRPED